MIDLPDRLTEPIQLTVVDCDGKHHLLTYRKHGKNTGSSNFEVYRKPLEALGALKNEKLGNAVVGIFDAEKGTEIIKMLWSKANYNLCEELKDIPEEYYC